MPPTLFTPRALADPYPAYHHLRSTDPVHWHEPFGAWVLTCYDDVLAALHDPRLRSDRVGRMREPCGSRDCGSTAGRSNIRIISSCAG